MKFREKSVAQTRKRTLNAVQLSSVSARTKADIVERFDRKSISSKHETVIYLVLKIV